MVVFMRDYIFIYNYILIYSDYIFIYCHPLTVSLRHNPSVWLDMLDTSSWDRNLPNFMWIDNIQLSYFGNLTSTLEFNTIFINFRLFTYYAIGYSRAQFVGIRVLKYIGMKKHKDFRG